MSQGDAITLVTLRKKPLSGTRGILCFSIFCYHICDHVFSYSSDYDVVMSSACSVLSVDRRQLPEHEKDLVACITKSGACNLNSLF